MHKAILMMLLAVVSSSAMAEWAEWVEVGSNDNVTSYADPATIRKVGNKVKVWELVDFKTVQGSTGFQFNSAKVQTQYDSKEEQTRILYATFHSENMGGGDVVLTHNNAAKWAPVTPDSVDEAMWKIACGK